MAPRERARRSHPKLTFYPAEVDGSPAAFVVDLEQEPKASHPTRIVVSVAMREPTDDGLRSQSEMARLDELHERISERLYEAFGAEHVGFYDLAGAATLVFYASGKATPKSVLQAIGEARPYAIEAHVAKDPKWDFYVDVLFPDEYAFQGIWNRAAIDEHEWQGDALYEPREVDHLVTFSSKTAAERCAQKLADAHFAVDGVQPAAEKGRFELQFMRMETLDGDKPNRFVGEILDLVLPLGGEYDGWSAPLVVENRADAKSSSSAKKSPKSPSRKTAKASAKTQTSKKASAKMPVPRTKAPKVAAKAQTSKTKPPNMSAKKSKALPRWKSSRAK